MKKRGLSLLLAILMVASVFSPAFPSFLVQAAAAEDVPSVVATAGADGAYATVITASDFQDGRSGNLHEATFSTMLEKAKADGVIAPDGFILGGDYDGSYADAHDTPTAYRRVESVITSAYPYFNKKNIINIQGNHDVNDPSVIDKTGPHEYDDYIVYVINNSDYPAGTGGTAAYNKTLETNENLVAYFNELKAEGETRPIFIATHIPLHHNSRNPKANNKDANGTVVSTGWNETLYSRILFDTINENAKTFDIIFLFGHNHSGAYDDYIGGSVNYIGKGQKIRIPDYNVTPSETSYTEETLNFTYMNYGYVGYSNNENNNTLTMNTFEICPDKIVATRYSTAGKYGEAKIIDRNMKTNMPSVTVEGYTTGKVGSADGVVAIASGFDDPVYTWSSSNEGIAKLSYNDRVAEIDYNAVGTATIKVKVTERNNSTKTAIYNYDVTVSEADGSTPGAAIYRAKDQVDGRTLEYYQITLGDTVALSGGYTGLSENASIAWSSSNTSIAKVNQYGLVTFVGVGTANITYTVTDNGNTYSVQVKLVVSTEKKVEYKYVQTTTITAGKSYVLASNYNNTETIYTDRTAKHDNVLALSGTATAFSGSAGSYTIQLDDESFVWDAVSAGNNQVYLQNADSGLYLAAYVTGTNDIGGSTNLGYFELTKAKPANGIWQMSGNVLQTTEGVKWYPRSNSICNVTSGTGRTTILFEQVPLEAYAEIEFAGDVVNGTTQTVYLAVAGRQIELESDVTNIQQIKSESWKSSNTDVAVIDDNGVVTFRGVQKGETVITYTATDAVTGTTVTASFTLSAILTAEKSRLFKYTETVIPGRKYIIANRIDNSSYALAFSSFEVTYTQLLGDRLDVTVEDGASYIEIPEHLTTVVWTPEAANATSFYLKNDANSKYLYANTDGTYDSYDTLDTNVYTSDSYASNTDQYTWTYENGSKLYNNFAYTDTKLGAQSKTYMRVRSAEFIGTSTESQSSVYFYEEIPAKPKAIITSRFEVLDEKVERTEICPFQTEQLLPTAQNFPDDTKVTFAWSSGNATIATVDQNGKITYTGKKGEVEITLTATSQEKDSTGVYPVATSTVTIEVIGGAGYVDPAETVYAENAFYKTSRLIPGRRYVMHTSYSDAPNLAISNQNKSGYVRLLCETIDAPLTDENGEYVVTTNNNFIWECVESNVSGYYLLKNVGNGQYFFTSESETTSAKHQAGVAANQIHPEADKVTNPGDTFLIKYEVKANGTKEYGMLFSKQVVDSGVDYGVGNVAKSSSGYYYFRPTTPTSSGSVPNSITLYEEPVKNSSGDEELPDGDVYLLTENFVIGNKYVLANNNVSGGAKAISNLVHKTWIKGSDVTVESSSNGVYIANPSDEILVFEAVASGTDGYVKLRTEDGKYLVASKSADPRIADIAEAGAYPESYYLFSYSGNYLKIGDGNNLFIDNENNGFRCYTSSTGSKMYLYALVERDDSETPEDPESVEVITQIRKQEEFGSVDVTRTMQYRYDVYDGKTEQILRYIRGVEFGYTTEWSVSDTSIATIDQNGLLTYTGNQGYVDIYLTVTGTDFAGNDITRTIKTTINVAADNSKTRIAIPETVYMTPASGASTIGKVYVNNVMNPDDSYNIETVAAREDNMYFGLRVDNAKSFTVSVSNVTNPSNDINLYTSTGSSVSELAEFSFDGNGVFEADEQYSLHFSGTGLQPGEKATAKWTITVTMNDGTTKRTYTLYTVMYAPGLTVGAVAESRQVENSQNEVASWISGANGVDHTKQAPLSTIHADYRASGYFKKDPLVYPVLQEEDGTSGESADDYIYVDANKLYVMQSATNGHDCSRSQSYLGLLTVDGSRYTNTNQIPNLQVGFDALRRGGYVKDSFNTFNTYYTLGTESSFTATDLDATPSGWIEYSYHTNLAESHDPPYRETVIPGFNVSDIDGKYIHAITRAQCIQDLLVRVNRQYATAGTSVLCTVTDKSTLRERVVSGYNVINGSAEFNAALQAAATVLGDPAATQTEIDEASRELYESMAEQADKYYTLKYDNLFSAFEYSECPNSMKVVGNRGTASYLNGTITVKNDTITGNEAYTEYGSGAGYYLVDLKPNTEYVFEYTVTTSLTAQAFMFFFNSSGGNAEAPTNMSVKVNDGAWTAKSETNSWWGNYTSGAGTYHYAIKFTTGATTVKAGFRFGNTGNDPVESTFSNFRLIDSAHYYEDATYIKTESIHKEYTQYGSLITPVRPGYIFLGWEDAHGITVTGDNSATENLTIYSQWKEVQYDVKFNGNGGAGSTTSAILTLNQPVELPGDFTRDNHTLLGWSFNDAATAPDFRVGDTVTVEDAFDYIDSNNRVTLYAVWERNYSVYYSANNGTGTVDHTYKPRSQAHILPDDSTITRDGYIFLGWALTPDATEPDFKPGDALYVGNIDQQYVNETKQEVILHAVWEKLAPQNVTFDNLVDISQWSTTAGNGTIVNPTDIGFTVKSNEGAGESTCSSAHFPITAGHKYVVDVDVKGDNWDIYFFFCDENGAWVEFTDSGNRLASYGLNVSKVEGTRYTSIEFTAPAGSVKAQLRVDANGSDNAVRFENIRVYDTANTTYLNTVNKYVEYGEAYGELPVPVKNGYQFLGWVDGKGNTVDAESIMNSTSTVYLTSTWTENTNTANDDTVVIEYGCPVTINVLANDKGGTVSGIGTTNTLTDKANALTLEDGTVTLNADGTITFTPSDTNVSKEIVFYYELNVSGAYHIAKVTIIPATTLYFEDTFFTFKDSTVTNKGKTYNYNWQTLGTPYTGVTQSADRPGTFNFYDNTDVNNVYGYDSKSDGQVSYSGGSVHFVEVDKIAGTSAPTATFTFTGTGFDLFSVTDSKSGTVTVTVYSGTTADASNRVMGIMSNTYFGYTHDAESDSLIAADNGALLQVPVIRAHDLSYGTYTVVVQPRYNYAFDVAKTGKSGVYVDSVRIYDPMGNENTVANDAYKADGEYAPQYLEVRDTLVASNKDGSFTVSQLGLGKSVFLDGGKTSMDDFANLGPKNEVYLQNGNSIAFHIVTDRADLPSTVQMGMKLTGKGGNTATVNLMNSEYNGWSEKVILNSTEERYYNIEAVVDWVQQPDGTFKTASPVIVTNTSDAIISLTSIKWAFDGDDNTATALNLMSDMDTPVLAMAAIMRMADPQVNPQDTILNKDNISYEFGSESYAPGEVGTLTITTEQGVSGVTVNATDVLDCVTNEDGKLEWTFEFTAESGDSMTFEIIARNEDGITSEAIYATIAIEADTTGDSGNDTTEPDDEITDDTIIDSGIGSITGIDSFAANLVKNIFALIAKVISLIFGGVMA